MTAKPETFHEHFSFLKTILLSERTTWFRNLDAIESVLLESQSSAYVRTDIEVALWGMLAECLIFKQDGKRLLKFGMDFFRYLNARRNTTVMLYADSVFISYCKGFFLLKDQKSLELYIKKLNQLEPPYHYCAMDSAMCRRVDEVLLFSKVRAHDFLLRMLILKEDLNGVWHELRIIRGICKPYIRYPDVAQLYVSMLRRVIELWANYPEIPHPEMIHSVLLDLEHIYAAEKVEDTATVLSGAYVVEYWKYQCTKKKTDIKKIGFQHFQSVKKLLHAYPENTLILINYLNLLCIRVDYSKKRFAIVSEEDWNLFEKLSSLRPDCLELMVFYRAGLEYRMDKAASGSQQKILLQKKYCELLLKMLSVFEEMEQQEDFTFPRNYPKPSTEEKINQTYDHYLSHFQEGFAKAEQDYLQRQSYNSKNRWPKQ